MMERSSAGLLLFGPLPHGLHLHGLRFAFPVAIQIEHGESKVWVTGRMEGCEIPESQLIWPLEPVRLTVRPHGRLLVRELHPAQAALCELASTAPRKPASIALSRNVFRAPQHDWHARAACQALNIAAPTALSRRLLSEGECLREIVVTQRLMRLLFDLPTGGNPLLTPDRYGFTDRSSLENSLYDRFGLAPDTIDKILRRECDRQRIRVA